MSRPSITASASEASSRWRSRMTAAHLRVLRDDGNRAVDARLPDRRRHVLAGDRDVTRRVELHRMRGGELPEALAVLERDVLAQRQPRHRPVHRARVEVADAQPLGEAACDRALARPCGPVDGDDHRLASESRSS